MIPQYKYQRERACNRVGFPSKKAAKGRALALGYEDIYRCKLCQRWHIRKSKGVPDVDRSG